MLMSHLLTKWQKTNNDDTKNHQNDTDLEVARSNNLRNLKRPGEVG